MPERQEIVVSTPYPRELTELMVAACNLVGCFILLDFAMPGDVRSAWLERCLLIRNELNEHADQLTHFGEAYDESEDDDA